MIVPARLLRRRLGLPPARSRAQVSEVVVRADDGARLATRLWRPAEAALRRGTVLVRSERAPETASPLELLARWLAEDGRTVILQSCRGRGRSEGRFRPFVSERDDGGTAIRWVRSQPWFDGRLALLGFGYSAFTAWAGLAAEPDAACALVAGFGARDPYGWIHARAPRASALRERAEPAVGAGVLQLETALALAARLDGREGRDPSQLDLLRAGRFLPVCESDRIAWRELEAFREWTLHPEPDGYWNERTPALPERPPATLQIAGWYEPALAEELADYRALAGRAEAAGTEPPSLCIGPWGASQPPRRERPRDAEPLVCVARATLRFLARAAGEDLPRSAPVRVYARGAGWREDSHWPPERRETRTFHLRSAGAANSQRGDGRLAVEAPVEGEPADVFLGDPADPVPSCGGVAFGSPVGPLDQAPVEQRADVLCFTSEPLPRPLEIAGAVRAVLYASSSVETSDLAAKLVLVDAGGAARWLAEGIASFTASGAEASELSIDLGGAAARVEAGERLRLEIASSSVPRFARHPHTAKARASFHSGEGRAARQRVFHDAHRPSALQLEVRAERPAPEPPHDDAEGESERLARRDETKRNGPAGSRRRAPVSSSDSD